MSNTDVVPNSFIFEDHQVRVVTDESGESWFNANDVCEILGYANPSKTLPDHVDGDDLTKREVIDTLGRTQQANHVNESGLYSLILGSSKPEAKRLKKWVTSEVLPSIRKTGGYVVRKAGVDALVTAIVNLGNFVATVPGVEPGIAAAATLNCVRTNTGIQIEDLRVALPALTGPDTSLNATKVGEALALGEGRRAAVLANRLLADAGLQFKNPRGEWELSSEGTRFASARPYSNKHSGYQILWKPEVAGLLREHLSAEETQAKGAEA
ncbi:MAG: Bro-N domain-containing protein [Bifidobacteriaceae bacterium]|jgi:prophage antirepressor-like protein|nr:Bro-N domain-containing protein [Bifidobacteriaceae bacterium]